MVNLGVIERRKRIMGAARCLLLGMNAIYSFYDDVCFTSVIVLSEYMNYVHRKQHEKHTKHHSLHLRGIYLRKLAT